MNRTMDALPGANEDNPDRHARRCWQQTLEKLAAGNDLGYTPLVPMNKSLSLSPPRHLENPLNGFTGTPGRRRSICLSVASYWISRRSARKLYLGERNEVRLIHFLPIPLRTNSFLCIHWLTDIPLRLGSHLFNIVTSNTLGGRQGKVFRLLSIHIPSRRVIRNRRIVR